MPEPARLTSPDDYVEVDPRDVPNIGIYVHADGSGTVTVPLRYSRHKKDKDPKTRIAATERTRIDYFTVDGVPASALSIIATRMDKGLGFVISRDWYSRRFYGLRIGNVWY